MTAVLLTDAEPNTPDWHATRRTGIGASEIAAVAGLSPYESAFSLWHKKKGNLPSGDDDREVFYWGHALEPLVADRYAAKHPEFWVMQVGIHAHADRRWQLASVDRALYPTTGVTASTKPLGVLEIKTTRYGDGYGRTGSDDIPLHVRCQVQQQMDVLEVPFADVAVLIGGSEYREYRIDYAADDAKTLRGLGEAFWNSLETEDEPPIDCSDSTYQTVRKLHPDIDPDGAFEISANLWATYTATREGIATREDLLRQMRAGFLHGMGSARFITVNDEPVLRRQMSSAGTPYLKEIA